MSIPAPSRFLAGPPGECCTRILKHEGEPVGRIETIAGIPTYVSDPPASTTEGPKKIIFYFSDIFGPLYINAKLGQDYLASHGYLVLGVDYFFGDHVLQHLEEDPEFDVFPWAMKKLEIAREATPKWIEEVRKLYGEDSIYCAAGYCFGGPFAMEIAATDNVVAAAFAHPTLVTVDHFKQIKKPLLMSCSEIDRMFPTSARHEAELILAERKATYYIEVFSGVVHGFATRGDLTVDDIRWAREHSLKSIITWFNRFSAVA